VRIISNLNGLSPQEDAWIYYCLKNNKKTLIATASKSTAVSLENKSIVYRPSGTYDILETPYTINQIAWEYLCEHKSIFCPNEKLNDRNYNDEVNEFIRDLRSVI